MAALKWRASTGPVALTANTTQTILQITAPANQRVLLKYLHVSFDGTNAALTPVNVIVRRQTSAGGAVTSSPPTPVLVEKGLDETVQSAVTWQVTTSEPTGGDVLIERYLPAYYGSLDLQFPLKDEVQIQGGGRLGIVFVTPSGVSPNVNITVECEE
jgi:hypothetical protein